MGEAGRAGNGQVRFTVAGRRSVVARAIPALAPHCKVCGIYTTTDDAARERAAKEALAEKLHLERVSQRGIARLTGMSRSTIIP